jgi:acetyl esterase/lipase
MAAAAHAAPPKPDPQMKAVLDQLAALKPRPIEKLTPAVARRQPLPSDAVMALLKKRGRSTAPEAVGSVTDTKVGTVPVRVYKPKGNGPFPVVVYAHGGGFVIASIQDYDSSCRALTNAANAIVVSVGYHYAPERKLPTQPMEMYNVTQWVANHGQYWGADKSRIAVAGESAGGAAATAVCLMAKQRKTKMPLHQLLVYPFVDASKSALNAPSMIRNAKAKPLNRAMVAWFDKHALPSWNLGKSPKYSPLYADVKGLPPATIVLAEIDPLLSQGQAYAQKLYRGVTHEFFGMGAVVDKAKEANEFAAAGLRSAFTQKLTG